MLKFRFNVLAHGKLKLNFTTTCLRIVIILLLTVIFLDIVAKVTPAHTEPDEPSVNSLKLLIELTKYPKTRPYGKFKFTFHKFGVCSLHYYQKRGLCEQIFSTKLYKFKMVPENKEYPNLSCTRIIIDASEVLKSPDSKMVSIRAYKCPNPYQVEMAYDKGSVHHKKFFLPIRFYVTGGLKSNSVILNYQHVALRNSPIKPNLVIFDLKARDLLEMKIERMREEYRRDSGFYLRQFKEKNVSRTSVNMNPIQRYAHLADNSALRNYEVYRKTAYLKFVLLYNKMNICAMIKDNKLSLCRQVFQTSAYKMLVTRGGKLGCARRRVLLNFSVKPPRVIKLASIVCPIAKWITVNSFLLSSRTEKNGLIAFMQIHPLVALLPDAIIQEINIHMLEKIPLYLTPTKQENDEKETKLKPFQ